MPDIKKKELVENIIKGVYYCYNNAPVSVIDRISRYVDKEVVDIKNKKETNHAGVQRNDLPGRFKVVGRKIYIRYKGKDISTGCNNTPIGWKLANKFWEQKYEEIDAILSGEIQSSDTIFNIFNRFLEYKKEYQKVSASTLILYKYRIKEVFGNDLNITLNEQNIKNSLDNFIKNTNKSATSINIILQGIRSFLNWASDDEQQYIAKKNYIKKYKQAQQKKIKPPYTVEEYLMFISHFENKKSYEMSLFLQFLWNTGARSKEAINIRISDIDLKNNIIKLPNKIYKGQEETLLLTDGTKEIIEKIISLNNSKDGRLFSWKGATTPLKNLEKLEKKLGIKLKGRGLHGFRRSFANKLCDSGLDIPEIQEAMRHRSIQTTLEHYKTFNKKNIIKKLNEKLK